MQPSSRSTPLPDSVVRAAEALLRRWIGLDVDTIGAAALERAIRSRMTAAGVDDAAMFAHRLETDLEQRDLLVEEIVVAESWFFRDPPVFDTLRSFAAARNALPGPRALRVLCAPCASGEEPFSVAMTLLAADWPAAWFTIDAVDVSRACLARAASGTFPANAFRNDDRGFHDRWFQADGAASRLDDAVRRAVNFSWGNVLDEAFVAGRDPYDVIFCRNLLIYLTSAARAEVERVLDRLLAPDGILILGAAEPPILRGPWIPAAERASFALRPGSPAAHGGAVATASAAARSRKAAAADRSPPPVAPGHAGRSRPGSTPPDLLHEAGRLANAGRHAEALQLCQRHERASGATPELSFLMAMIHQSTGDPDRAEACLHQTLSLDPGHEEALLSLCLAASRRGDTALAEHYRQSAARAFARKEER